MAESTPQTRPTHVMEDPSAKTVARVYSSAFLSAAAAKRIADPLEEFTSFHDDVLGRNAEFERLLTSNVTNRDQKLSLIERVIKPRASELFTNFLTVLARHDRLDLLPLILQEAWIEHEKRSGKKRVLVKSAVPLNESQMNSVRTQLRSKMGFEPILIPKVDEKLLGGLVIQIDDTVYDSSLRTQLLSLKRNLQQRYVHEIQSGRNRFSHSEGN